MEQVVECAVHPPQADLPGQRRHCDAARFCVLVCGLQSKRAELEAVRRRYGASLTPLQAGEVIMAWPSPSATSQSVTGLPVFGENSGKSWA